jgi:hypothetical protein
MANYDRTKDSSEQVQFKKLLEEAVTKPGLISSAYSRFWRYSIGNQILALVQCEMRGIQPGPIATFPKWKELGRYVRKGEKAITLCMPITHKFVEKDIATGEQVERVWQTFTYKPHWFVISQTEGKDVQPEPIPTWNRQRAIKALGVEQIEFQMLDGNAQGYAVGQKFAINPVAALPMKTTFHELAHIVLGHTSESILDESVLIPRSLREAEAESVALLCLESLGMEGTEYCRGYIQNWLQGAEIPERSAQRIFAAADKILKAGIDRPVQGGAE